MIHTDSSTAGENGFFLQFCGLLLFYLEIHLACGLPQIRKVKSETKPCCNQGGLMIFQGTFILYHFFHVMNLSYRSLLSAGTGLAVSVGSIGLGFIFTQPVFAGTKLFANQKIVVKADPPNNPEETFIFDLETDDFLTTITRLGYMNPGTVTPNPNDPLPPPS